MKKILFGLTIVLFFSCSPRVTTQLIKPYPTLDYKEEVFVIGLSEEAPPSATEIGTVKINDTGFSTNCGWEVVIGKAKLEARKVGGNAIKITEHRPSSITGSTCDNITAKILKVDNAALTNATIQKKIVSIDSNATYATLYVYRPNSLGFLVGYNLYLDDSLICRVKGFSKHEIKITNKGAKMLWARTEARVEVPIEIEFGKSYYLQCGMTMGIIVGHPQLQLVDESKGRGIYQNMRGK